MCWGILSRKSLCGRQRFGLVGATNLCARFSPGTSVERLATLVLDQALFRSDSYSQGKSPSLVPDVFIQDLPLTSRMQGELGPVRR